MTLAAEVVELLAARGIPSAVIGAAALAVHGASRATEDIDLLAADPRCLGAALWEDLRATGVESEVRLGDPDDPLAGVVRFERPGDRPVDLIVGRGSWQRDLLLRAQRQPIDASGAVFPVVGPADLVLLKLYAGGPQDAWDIRQLLLGPLGRSIRAEVGQRLEALPPEARQLWSELAEP